MTVVTQVVVMMLLILLGILCYKIGIVTKQVGKGISSLVLKVVNPVVILVSYQKPFDQAMLAGLGWAFVLSGVCYLLALVLPLVLVRGGRDKGALAVERFSAIYSNCAFMGIPLVQGVFGADGVFYLTAFITLFNIFVWTHGLITMRGTGGGGIRAILPALKTPALIATFVGLVLFLCNLQLPEIPMLVLNDVAALNTPLAMFAAGAVIAQTNLLSAVKNLRVYWICAVRLLIVPAASLLVMRFLPVDPVIAGTCLLAAACPTAATGTLFAIEYGKNSAYASELFAMTTILSMATLPIVMLVWGV